MSKQQHTPGPWAEQISGGTLYVTSASGGVVCAPQGNAKELRANARLIAAAPELLAALVEYIAAGENSMNPKDGDDVAAMIRFGEAEKSARAAIAKATGA